MAIKKSSSTFKDLTGKVFGKLTVIKRVSEIGAKHIKWECKCECGNTSYPSSGNLLKGTTRSCGCGTSGGFKKSKKKLEEKQCSWCGNMFQPDRKSDKYCCIECRKEAGKAMQFKSKNKEKHRNAMAEWRRKNPAKRILSNLKQRGNIDLDEKWIQERLDKGVCEVTGIPFEYFEYGTTKPGFNYNPFGPSVDKINPDEGYKKSNCRLVCWAYNRAKGIWSDEVIKKMCKGVIDNGVI